MEWTRHALASVVVVIGLVACTKKPPTTVAASASSGGVPKDVDCRAVHAPADPELMAWDASARVELDKLRHRGVVAVQYEAHGCDVSLELLPLCIGPKDRYVYSPFSTSQTKIAHDVKQLFAQLPLGATNVSSLLDGHRALRLDTKLVGTVALPAGTTVTETDLVGAECKRATHIISTLYVGGFAMAATDPNQVNATNLFELTEPREGLKREGYAQACKRADAEKIELAGCAVPLRVALTPLDHTTKPIEANASGGRVKREVMVEPSGAFDQNAIEKVVRDGGPIVKRKCWEPASPTVKRVEVAVTVTVDTEGRVVRAQPQLADSEGPVDLATIVAKCVSSEIQAWPFPKPDAERSVILPFYFIRQ
jgi:hypothetical protein